MSNKKKKQKNKDKRSDKKRPKKMRRFTGTKETRWGKVPAKVIAVGY